MKVRIKDWEVMFEEYGIDEDGDINCNYIFSKDMKEYCGKVIEVEDIIICDGVNVFMYDCWVFSEEMYEVIEE